MIKDTDYLIRHSIDLSSLKLVIESFKKLKVMVIGDLIIDEYIDCEPLGMSQEDATVVVTPIETKRYIGGAGIVAAHIGKLGSKVRFFTISGQDEAANFAENFLNNEIDCHFFSQENRITTLKQRFKAANKTVFRLTQLHRKITDQKVMNKMLDSIERYLDETDLIVFSDFNYGCLPQDMVDHICSIADEKKIPMVADSQTSSQHGDIARFKNMLLITPTEIEARLSVRDSISDLEFVAEKLKKLSSVKHIIVTQGMKGLSVFADKGNDVLPGFNTTPVDVAGAGDSFLAASSLALVAGATIWESAYLGSVMAGIQVSRQGNTPIEADKLIECVLSS